MAPYLLKNFYKYFLKNFYGRKINLFKNILFSLLYLVCGLCFPTKIEYANDTEKHSAGIVEWKCLDDFKTYETLVERIKSITKPLKLDWDGKVLRTSVRISDEAKKDFGEFYFITYNNITVI